MPTYTFTSLVGSVLGCGCGDRVALISCSPTQLQLGAFARRCRRPLAALFLPEPPSEAALPPSFRRLRSKTADTFSAKTALAMRAARRMQNLTSWLYDQLEEAPRVSLPYLTESSDAEEAGAAFRAALGISINIQRGWRGPHDALSAWRAGNPAIRSLCSNTTDGGSWPTQPQTATIARERPTVGESRLLALTTGRFCAIMRKVSRGKRG